LSMKTRRTKIVKTKRSTMPHPARRTVPRVPSLIQRLESRRKAQLEIVRFSFASLDNVIWSNLFSFLSIKDLCKISPVCRAFTNYIPQNAMWRALCAQRFQRTLSGHPEGANWKKVYLSSMKRAKHKKLNSFVERVISRAKMNHSVPNTSKLVDALDIEYSLRINGVPVPHDKRKGQRVRSFASCTVLKVQDTASLSPFSLAAIRRITVSLNSKRLFERIELSFAVYLDQMTVVRNLSGSRSDDTIQLYSQSNIHFAVYDEHSIAFIVLALNHYPLLSRVCPSRIEYARYFDVRDPFGWKCQITLRDLKKVFLYSVFREMMACPDSENAEMTRFELLSRRGFDAQKMESFPVYPWKSDTFQGRERGVFEVDVAVLNHENRILFAKSLMADCVQIDDLYNFEDQSNGFKRFLFRFQNKSELEMLRVLSGNIVVLDGDDKCELQSLSLCCK